MVYLESIVVLGSYIKVADTGDSMKADERIICKKPMAHKPEFEGKHHCNHCAREMDSEGSK